MSGEYLAQSKHQISANRLHKNVRLRIGFRRRTFLWQLDDIIKTAGCPRLSIIKAGETDLILPCLKAADS